MRLSIPAWTLLIVLPAIAAVAEELPNGSSVEVTLRPRAAVEALRGELVFVPEDAETDDERRVEVHGRGAIEIDLPPGTWKVCPQIDEWWGRCASIESGMADRLEVELWPTARLSGELRVAHGIEGSIPDSVTVEVQPTWPPRAGLDFPASDFHCAVDEQQIWTCAVPAGWLDVAVRIQGYVPHYAWGLEAPRGEDRSLGEMVLRRGSSLVGQATVEEGELTGEARAVVSPALLPGSGSPDEKKRLAQVRLEASVGPRGFFQIVGIPPGSYVLDVTNPGHAPARAFPIEIWPDAETVLDRPVVLRKPFDLEVMVTPQRDWLDRPWRLRIFRRAEFSAGLDAKEVFLGSAGTDGRVEVADQAPGDFVVYVEDLDGNRWYGDAGTTVRTPAEAFLAIELDTVFVTGELLLGDEPIPGTLWFGGRHGAKRSEMAADLDGRFSGVLPHDGSWRVDVDAEEVDVQATTRIDVETGPSGHAEVTVELPDTELFGRVVDGDGAAVEGALVKLGSHEGGQRQRSAADGSFTFRGMPPGLVTLAAEAKRLGVEEISDGTMVTVSESVPLGPVVVTLRSVQRFAGRVTSSRGPVVGATVDVMPLRPLTAAFHGGDRTDLQGRFDVEIHPAAEALQVTISPPGFALSTQEVPADGEPVLEVSEEGGQLVVTAALPDTGDRQHLVVLRDGLVIPTPLLQNWAAGHGVRWSPQAPVVIPELAPGNYRACLGTKEDFDRGIAEGGRWVTGLRNCADGYLPSRGELRLDLQWQPPRSEDMSKLP